MAWRPIRQMKLFTFEGKVGAGRSAGGNGDFRGLGSELLLPCRHGVASRRNIFNGVIAISIGFA